MRYQIYYIHRQASTRGLPEGSAFHTRYKIYRLFFLSSSFYRQLFGLQIETFALALCYSRSINNGQVILLKILLFLYEISDLLLYIWPRGLTVEIFALALLLVDIIQSITVVGSFSINYGLLIYKIKAVIQPIASSYSTTISWYSSIIQIHDTQVQVRYQIFHHTILSVTQVR